MKFFSFWIATRIKERGWPKARGLLRRRKVITEEVVIAATQDAIRIAITIGGSLPDIAKAIAITYMDTSDEPLTQKAVEKWIERGAAMGDEKLTNLSDIHPQWLRFCSITAASSKGDSQYFLWTGSGHEEYDMKDNYSNEIWLQGTALAGIAMCWAYKHPNRTENLFKYPDDIEVNKTELRELVSGRYSGWLNMAKMMVSEYSEEEGFPKFEDLA